MHRMLLIESAVRGLLYVNGQFCGPLEEGGQAFPAGGRAEIYIQLFPFGAGAAPLGVQMHLHAEGVALLDPQDCAFALVWPDGVVQLELRMPQQAEEAGRQQAASGVLLRYLALRLAGDERAGAMLMRPQDAPPQEALSAYHAAVPLRFFSDAPERFDDRAGLVCRVAPNIARIDAALAVTVPAGQGRRLIERIEILRQ